MKLILGCGYLGRRVAEAWRAAGTEVAALTRSSERAREFAAARIKSIIGDVTEPATLRALPEADVLLWAVGLDRASGKSQHDVYVAGLANTLRAMAGRVGRVIFISSSSVYGQIRGEWVDESSPCEPTRPNGRVMLEAESLLAPAPAFPPANVLRLSGIYGPHRLLRRLADLHAGQPFTGNPEAWLNLIHVDDAVQAVLACETRGTPGACYLVSDDRPIRRREYYELLARLAKASPPRFAELDPACDEARDFNKRCRNRRLREELGVELRFPTIDTGLPQAMSS